LIIPNDIRVILFDLDGTLRHNRPAFTDSFMDYAAQQGVNASLVQRWQTTRWTHYYWASSQELAADDRAFGGLEAEFWTNYARRCLEVLGASAEVAHLLAPEMHRYMSEDHQTEDWVPPEVPETLQALKEAGFRLGVVSNREHSYKEYLTQVGLLEYFDLALVAGEVEAWKPDPRIFEHALDQLGYAPVQAVYVGDNYYADIQGAYKAGLQPVLIDPDGLFPEAECPIIHSLAELPGILSLSLER